MPLSCPRCDSQHTTTLDYARKTGTVVGTTAGAAGSAAAALGGAQTGAALGMVAGRSARSSVAWPVRSWAR